MIRGGGRGGGAARGGRGGGNAGGNTGGPSNTDKLAAMREQLLEKKKQSELKAQADAAAAAAATSAASAQPATDATFQPKPHQPTTAPTVSFGQPAPITFGQPTSGQPIFGQPSAPQPQLAPIATGSTGAPRRLKRNKSELNTTPLSSPMDATMTPVPPITPAEFFKTNTVAPALSTVNQPPQAVAPSADTEMVPAPEAPVTTPVRANLNKRPVAVQPAPSIATPTQPTAPVTSQPGLISLKPSTVIPLKPTTTNTTVIAPTTAPTFTPAAPIASTTFAPPAPIAAVATMPVKSANPSLPTSSLLNNTDQINVETFFVPTAKSLLTPNALQVNYAALDAWLDETELLLDQEFAKHGQEQPFQKRRKLQHVQ